MALGLAHKAPTWLSMVRRGVDVSKIPTSPTWLVRDVSYTQAPLDISTAAKVEFIASQKITLRIEIETTITRGSPEALDMLRFYGELLESWKDEA